MVKRDRWARFRYMPCLPLGKDGRRVTGSEAHRVLARTAAEHGMVLLKNGGMLPLRHGSPVAVFGKGQTDFVKGGGGSGDVTSDPAVSLLEGLRNKEKQGKLTLLPSLGEFYLQNTQEQYDRGVLPGKTSEPELPQALFEQAAEWTDTALFVVSRYAREEIDHKDQPGDYRLSAAEQKLLHQVMDAFPHVAVILNIGAPIEATDFADQAEAVLLMGHPGMEGGNAAANILCGDAYPSGKLTATYARRYQDWPTANTFGTQKDYEEYQEDIFVGYRYFETIPGAKARVCWPFGFGLGYTSFQLECLGLEKYDAMLRVSVNVVNTGARPGREVVQVYVKRPKGLLSTPAVTLCGFQKTRELMPGEIETVVIEIPRYALASYDDIGVYQKSAWVLPGGTYELLVGTSVDACIPQPYAVPETVILRQLEARCTPTGLCRRMQADGTFREVPDFDPANIQTVIDPGLTEAQEYQLPREEMWNKTWLNEAHPTLEQVAAGKITLDDFLDGLTLQQQVHLLGGQPNRGPANTYGIGNLEAYGVPNIMTADGPAGLRIEPQVGIHATAFPCASQLACSWEPELVEAVGAAGAKEVLENGIGLWLTPAMNIQRDPLCGRNFEYYSEDPLVSGVMASAMIRGIQSQGVGATVKHFAANNREWNRKECDARVSERALREIYLWGFAYCVLHENPMAVMTSYNPLNGHRTSENPQLLIGILREEWGYQGLVMTDWWNHAAHAKELGAGNDVRMPAGEPEQLMEAIRSGSLTEVEVRRSAKRVLELILRLGGTEA